jgi:endonuclease/exonuclease/phosphatase family metal-dependent hydrolase
VAAVLRDLRPDVALVQEAPRLLGSGFANARLARRAGLLRVTGGAAAAGNLLLVSRRVVVDSAQAVRLPKRRGLHRRGAVRAVLSLDGHRLRVLGTHLDLDPAARLATAARLRALGPVDVVAGDLNEEPGGPAWRALSDGLVDVAAGCGPTFPLRAPRRRIDAVFVGPAWQVRAVEVPRVAPVTDHLPVVVDLAPGP